MPLYKAEAILPPKVRRGGERFPMKLSAKTLYPNLSKKMLASMAKSFAQTSDKWIVVSANGTSFHTTEAQALEQRAKLKEASVFGTVHLVNDVSF
jgi:UDP-N-acetylmuramyl tripeptide synthase